MKDFMEGVRLEDHFDPDPVLPTLQVMERSRQEHLAAELVERLVYQKRYGEAKKVGWYMWERFNNDSYIFN